MSFGTRKWGNTPSWNYLEDIIDWVNCKLTISTSSSDLHLIPHLQNIGIIPECEILMEFNSEDFILNWEYLFSKEWAIKIHDIYTKFLKKIEYIFHTIWKMNNCLFRIKDFYSFLPENDLFSSKPLQRSYNNVKYNDVSFHIDKDDKDSKIKRNPTYLRKNLLDNIKLKNMQKEIKNCIFNENINELLHLQTEIIRHGSRFSIVEASSLLEILFAEIVINKYIKLWLSKKEIDDLKNSNITFSNIINSYIPLFFTPISYIKIKQDLNNINILRKMRNKIVHEKLREIDVRNILKGINSWIKIYQILLKK